MEQIRNAEIYGVRPKRTFREAATKYLNEATKVTISDDAMHLKFLDPFIGDLNLEAIHMGTLQPFIDFRKTQKVKNRTINHAIQTVRHILNLASSEWIDQQGRTWIEHAPRLKFLAEPDRRSPYPLSWKEQERFFDELPEHLRKMALFKVNTGCREAEVCGLRWEWEEQVPPLWTHPFLLFPRIE
jgi:integrase